MSASDSAPAPAAAAAPAAAPAPAADLAAGSNSQAEKHTLAGMQEWAEKKFPTSFALLSRKVPHLHFQFGYPGPIDRSIYESGSMLNIGTFVPDDDPHYTDKVFRWQLYACLRKNGNIDFVGYHFMDFSERVRPVSNDDLINKCVFKFVFRSILLPESKTRCVRRLKSLCMFFYLWSPDHPAVTKFKPSKYIKPQFFREACAKIEEVDALGIFDKQGSMEEVRYVYREGQRAVGVVEEEEDEEE